MTLSLLLYQTAECLGKFIIYVIPCAAVLLILYFFCHIPKFVFRKFLHFIAFSCVTLMIAAAGSWMAASLAAVIVALAVYPVLSMLESRPWFAGLFVQKSKGEVKRSLLMLFFMFALLNTVAWGVFGKAAVGAAAILMWGIGDAAAALVGIPFGRHKVISRFTDGKKSYEGTAAMFAAAFISGVIVLGLYAGISPAKAALCACAGAACGAIAELITSSEYDTVSVPLTILVILLVLC